MLLCYALKGSSSMNLRLIDAHPGSAWLGRLVSILKSPRAVKGHREINQSGKAHTPLLYP
jgi:hypothetical protein